MTEGHPSDAATGEVDLASEQLDALRAENARLRAALGSAGREQSAILSQLAEGVIVTDAEGRITFVNAAAARIHGVARLDVAPADYSETYHLFTEDGEPYPPDQLPLARTVATGEPVIDARWRIRTPDGRDVMALGSARPVFAENGARLGSVLTLRDETARAEAEAALRESEARFRAMADSAPAPVWVTTAEGIAFANKAFGEVAGLPPEEITGEVWLSLIHPDDRAQALERRSGAWANNEDYGFEARFRRADGVQRWMQVSCRRRFDAAGTLVGYVGIAFDITETRETEAALRESEARFRAMADSAPVMIWVTEADGACSYLSRSWYEFTGQSEAEGLGTGWLDAVHPDDCGRTTDLFLTANAARIPFRFEYRLRSADGSYRWAIDAASPRFSEAGEFLGYVGSVVDIDERKAAEDGLRETTRRLDAVLANTRMAVFMMDHRQRCVYANAAAEQLTGYSFDELCVGPLHDVVHHLYPDGRPYPIQDCPIDRAFPEENQVTGEELFVHKDGGFYPVGFTASPIRDEAGRTIGTVIEARAIAQEKARDAALAHRSQQLQGLAEAALAVARAPTLEAMLDIIVREARRVVGAHQGVLSLTRGEGWAQAINTVALTDKYAAWRGYDVLPEGNGIYAWVCEQNRPARMTQAELEEHPRWGGFGAHAARHPPMRGWLAAPLVGRDGRNLGLVQLSDKEDGGDFDETDEAMLVQLAQIASAAIEQSVAETALRNLNETLEQRVDEEVAQRTQAEETLRQAQKMEAVGQLTGGIAHDFNNLLTVITGNVDAARRHLGEEAPPRVQRALGNALIGAERAAVLTQRLLAFSRRQPLKPVPIDPNKLVGGMSDLLHRTLGETIQVETVLAAGAWRVEADANQLENAILNLAVNARDAMPEGGKVTIETSNTHFDRAYAERNPGAAPGQYVAICVSDTGAGMDADTISRAFEPFFTTKDVGKGTGLGLSMVYGFVRQSGGNLKIYSEPGEGTTVRLYLPRLLGAEAEAEEAAQAPPLEGGREEVILVCEDDDDVRAYTVEALRDLGYHVLEAHDGPAALRLLERPESAVDLLFTDVVLPGGMSGAVLAKEAKALRPDLRILFTTGYARNAIVHHGRLDPGVELITKPFAYADLATRVREMLDRD